MIEELRVSRTPRTWTAEDPEPADRPKVKDRRGTVWYWRDDLPEYEPGHWTTDWNEHGSWQALARQLWPLVEVLPDAPTAEPGEQAKRSLATRLITVANDVYGNDTRNVLDAPTGHGLAAVLRVLADGPLIQTEWSAAQFRKLADELEVTGP